MRVPDADPNTFKVLQKVTEYTNQEIQDFCQGPGNYAVYTDKRKTYLFQFWNTPTFGKTRIEVVKELNPDTLSVADRTFTSGTSTMMLGYKFATTSCSFILEPA